MADEMVRARSGLLDALEALEAHLEALVVVGAQAIYLHTGTVQVAIAELTNDGDVVVDPQLLSADPLIEEAMIAAGFSADPRESALGTWISPLGVPVDLMVPDAVAGRGRRGARVPPHDPKSMRRTRGLEAALVDNSKLAITSLANDDPRSFTVSVAGPAALLVAKIHKIHDRMERPTRLDNKDAHDIYRLLRAIEVGELALAISHLLTVELSAVVTREALDYLQILFADGPGAMGSMMAGATEELVGDPALVAESVALLAQDLLGALNK